MNVAKACQKNVITIGRFDELWKAVQLMRERHVGYLVVVEPDAAEALQRPVGVLTDRDILITVTAREADAHALRVDDVMTRQPLTVSETESIDKALRDMRRIGVRRVPVTGPRGELSGILSLDDVLDVLASELQNVAGSIHHGREIEGTLRP